MGGYLNRERASAYMAEMGLDALVLTQPETITYAAGVHPGVAAISRRAAAGLLLVPADRSSPLAAVVGDGQVADFKARTGIEEVRGHPLWFDSAIMPPSASRNKSAAGHLVGLEPGRNEPIQRPAQFDPEIALRELSDIMRGRKLDKGKIGLELAFVPVADMPLFEAALPDVSWEDSSQLVCRLRSIKRPEEIALLRRSAFLSDAGLYHLRDNIREGHTAEDMVRIWREGAAAQAERDKLETFESSWAFVSVGPTAFAAGGPFKKGDVVRLDLGCVTKGYSSDVGRTWSLGKPSVAQQSVYDALRDAFETCLPIIKAGTPIRDLHRTAMDVMHRHGFDNYVRGHFGHGLGASVFSEEWPFLSPDEEGTLEENMVIAFETPYYIDGLGNFIVEDQMLITRNGHENMYTFDRGLLQIDG
jgi:Xaa-Pro aminopeptidase